MDEQVAVFLYSIARISSFTLSSSLPMALQRRNRASEQPLSRGNVFSSRRYHFSVLKNE
jgi:hypothetical protein